MPLRRPANGPPMREGGRGGRMVRLSTNYDQRPRGPGSLSGERVPEAPRVTIARPITESGAAKIDSL